MKAWEPETEAALVRARVGFQMQIAETISLQELNGLVISLFAIIMPSRVRAELEKR